MSAWIYVLQFQKNTRYYVGSTDNLKRRLYQHAKGNTPSTKSLGSFQMVFQQKVASLAIARRIEKRIKSWKRKDFIEKIIKDGFIKAV